MSSEPVYLSKNGRIKLEKELLRLKSEERTRIISEISTAMQQGDLSENAEYHAAKEEQVHIERQIANLEDKLSRTVSIDISKIPTDKAYLFAKVLITDMKRKEDIEYTLSPPDEADVDNDIISVKSPIGAALLGKSVGDTVEIQVPAGKLKYKIKKISREEV
ncbi:MAG: transcription elongation factor GreA [candidate division Zixibacteria bacterium]|nr:transcription elongation factor GreA [candidate division Zixibacteria bacterium]